LPISGLDTTLRNLAALAVRVPGAAEDFLLKEGHAILNHSLQLVPHESGDLASSGEVKRTGGNITGGVGRQLFNRTAGGQFGKGSVEVAYGKSGPASNYAHVVHNTPSPSDPPTWQGKTVQFKSGQPRFLEIPFRESVSTLYYRLGIHLLTKLRGV
jgi:hypothetical protein